MKNEKTFMAVLKEQYGQVSSSEINNCAVRVNDIPIFENVIGPDGHLRSDLELSLRNSSDPEIQDLINSGFYAERPASSLHGWSNPAGTRHVSLAEWFDSLSAEPESSVPSESVASEPESSVSSESEPSKSD